MVKILEALKRYYGETLSVSFGEKPFRVLIGCILSQSTRDANASRAANALFGVAESPEDVLSLDEAELKTLIRPSGFFNMKARYIVEACKEIQDRFGGVIPRSREELMSLPGVGPKTADIVLSYGYGEPAIAVDTHILRVSKRIGLAKPDSNVEEVKDALEGSISKSEYMFTDLAFLKLGKDFCRSGKPLCGRCPISALCEKKLSAG